MCIRAAFEELADQIEQDCQDVFDGDDLKPVIQGYIRQIRSILKATEPERNTSSKEVTSP